MPTAGGDGRGVRRAAGRAPRGAADERTAYLITYGDGDPAAGETPLHTLAGFLHDHVGDVVSDVHLLPMFPWTSDDGFAVVDHRAGEPRPRHLGRRRRPGRRARPDVRLRRQPHLEQQPVVPRLAGRDPAYEGFYVERDPDFDVSRVMRPRTTPAVPRVPAAGRQRGVGLDDVRRGPGRRRRPAPADAGRADRRAARVPRARRLGDPPRRDRLPLEGVRHDLHPPAADARGDQALARAGRARRAGRTAADRDERPARGEHLLLRRRRRRGPPRLPVRAAAAGAALVRRRVDRAAQRLGRGHRAGERRPPPGSTSWPATTASACGPPRASSTTTSAPHWWSAPAPMAAGCRWRAGRTAAGRSTS